MTRLQDFIFLVEIIYIYIRRTNIHPAEIEPRQTQARTRTQKGSRTGIEPATFLLCTTVSPLSLLLLLFSYSLKTKWDFYLFIYFLTFSKVKYVLGLLHAHIISLWCLGGKKNLEKIQPLIIESRFTPAEGNSILRTIITWGLIEPTLIPWSTHSSKKEAPCWGKSTFKPSGPQPCNDYVYTAL